MAYVKGFFHVQKCTCFWILKNAWRFKNHRFSRDPNEYRIRVTTVVQRKQKQTSKVACPGCICVSRYNGVIRFLLRTHSSCPPAPPWGTGTFSNPIRSGAPLRVLETITTLRCYRFFNFIFFPTKIRLYCTGSCCVFSWERGPTDRSTTLLAQLKPYRDTPPSRYERKN